MTQSSCRQRAAKGGEGPAVTVVDLLRQRVLETPQACAYVVPGPDTSWRPIQWDEYHSRAERLSWMFHGLGLGRGERVGILAPTSLMWELAQMAALRVGACVVGIDVNCASAQLAAVVEPLDLVGLLVGDETLAQGIPSEVRNRLKFMRLMQALERELDAAQDIAPIELSQRMRDIRPPGAEDDAVIVFSSGTTGTPKAICYRHGQLMDAVRAIRSHFPDVGTGSTLVCWLPLANLFQRMINFAAMASGATSYLVSDPRTVMACLPVANPDLLVGVPRFFEKVHAGIHARLAGSGMAAMLARHAVAVGHARAAALRQGRRPPFLVAMWWPMVDWLVLRRLRQVFGRKMRYCVSGSAPMPHWLLAWFDAIGLPVLEAYGVSENIMPMAISQPGARRFGSVGKVLPGNVIHLADDGEIMVRGSGVFSGYLAQGQGGPGGQKRPVVECHATGDLGRFDEQGFLYVTGRKADIFKTSTGRWIVSSRIEERLRRLPYIEHSLVLGAHRKAVVALICLAPDSFPEAADAHACACRLGGDFDRVLSDLASHEHPAAALIIRQGFSIQGGEVTGNLKLRRKFIESRYMQDIERLYERMEKEASLRPHGADARALVVEYA